MVRNYYLFYILLLLSLCIQTTIAAQHRVALIIGNSAYKSLPSLRNASNDANDIAIQLKLNGFEVTKLINVNKRTMDESIRKFSKQLNNKNTVGLFYFAGHGVQVKNRNYIIPLTAEIKNETDVEYNAVGTGWLLSQMERAENDFNLVILDACRDNPFPGGSFRSATRGLAKADNLPKGSMILYAASPGQQAEDGTGRNGLFTSKLLQAMKSPGLTVDEVINQTAREVYKSASDGQLPYKEGIILNDFYFNNMKIINKPKIRVTSSNSDMASKQENTFWNSVFGSGNPDMYQAYLKDYPNGHFKRLALIKIKELKDNKNFNPNSNIKEKATHAKLTLRSNLSGDRVSINGKDKGSTKLEIQLATGVYEIEVSKAGYKTWERSLQIQAGIDQVVFAKLKKQVKQKLISATTQENISVVNKVTPTSRPRSIKDSSIGMELIKIPSGCFQMGSYDGKNEKPVHEVCITHDYYLGKFEVTQGQWKMVMGNNPSHFKKGDNHPVEKVNWDDIQTFIRKLNNLTGERYRLPTEAEWEYACRSGGKNEKYCGSNAVDSVAWIGEKWQQGHHEVGGKSANGLGLYDMSGNIWELVHDWYDVNYYKHSPRNNPTGASGGSFRSYRGGSWYRGAKYARSTRRRGYEPSDRDHNMGFRLARTQ